VRLSDFEAETRGEARCTGPGVAPLRGEENLPYELDKAGGKGSHYRLRLGDAVTTVQSGELTPLLVNRICKQLGVDPAVI
jgi:hypothetical protein